jgi:hypothetical protein
VATPTSCILHPTCTPNERTGGDAADQYALVVINTNGRHMSTTAAGAKAMKVGRPGVTLVDVLDPEQKTYAVPAPGELRLPVPQQQAMILVPQDQLKP